MSDVIVHNMDFNQARMLTVTGIPNANCSRFSINVGNSDEEIALHMDCRFNYLSDRNTIVCNSCYKGKWDEEKKDKNFPFAEGRLFEIKINFIGQEFVIILQNGAVIRFPNRLGADNYRYLKFKDDAQIQSIEIK